MKDRRWILLWMKTKVVVVFKSNGRCFVIRQIVSKVIESVQDRNTVSFLVWESKPSVRHQCLVQSVAFAPLAPHRRPTNVFKKQTCETSSQLFGLVGPRRIV